MSSSSFLSDSQRLQFLTEAVSEAEKGLSEGGIPIGSVLVDPNKMEVVAR